MDVGCPLVDIIGPPMDVVGPPEDIDKERLSRDLAPKMCEYLSGKGWEGNLFLVTISDSKLGSPQSGSKSERRIKILL